MRHKGVYLGTYLGKYFALSFTLTTRVNRLPMRHTIVPMAPAADLPFENQIHDAFGVLRGALIELFASVEADAFKPYPAAKRLEVNKNLTWKASKIIRATGPSEAIRHVPGKGGVKLLIDAFKRHGAPDEIIHRTRAAFESFDTLIERHSGDKETLELMLDGLPSNANEGESLVATRKLAYRGNSGIWGMQTKARITTFVLAPTEGAPAGSNMFDSLLLTGFLGLQRLRPETPWTLLRLRSYQDDGTDLGKDHLSHSLDRGSQEKWGLPLLTEFSTRNMQPLAVRKDDDELVVELLEGPVGKQGNMDIFFGRIDRSFASLKRTPEDQIGEFLSDYTLPIENAQFDVIIHEDLPPLRDFSFNLFSRLDGHLPPPSQRRGKLALPIPIEVRDLGLGIHSMATPLYPRYTDLISKSFSQVGLDPARFRTLRATVEFPPLCTTGVFSFPLPEGIDD